MSEFPIIFLDVDSVLNSPRWFDSAECKELRRQYATSKGYSDAEHLYHTMFDPKQVQMLKEILEKTGARIVLSSTWRKLDITRDAFAMNRAAIPNLEELWIGNTASLGGDRGEEIDHWIRSVNFKGKFVILDDWDCMEPHMDKLVQTCWGNGMLRKHADEVIKRLTLQT
jgi:hypothetical protein